MERILSIIATSNVLLRIFFGTHTASHSLSPPCSSASPVSSSSSALADSLLFFVRISRTTAVDWSVEDGSSSASNRRTEWNLLDFGDVGEYYL